MYKWHIDDPIDDKAARRLARAFRAWKRLRARYTAERKAERPRECRRQRATKVDARLEKRMLRSKVAKLVDSNPWSWPQLLGDYRAGLRRVAP